MAAAETTMHDGESQKAEQNAGGRALPPPVLLLRGERKEVGASARGALPRWQRRRREEEKA